ncbi:MAG: PDZ domain-containing protein [Gammaproteobacteria bacterium]|nr:PDZ domain-containing protein [Gammaproteobacteria bacterium]
MRTTGPHKHANPRGFIWVFAILAAFLAGCATPDGGYRLNPGAYTENYIELVRTDAPFLEHPTGTVPDRLPPTRLRAGYAPLLIDTDNMDQKTLELREQGYVMIGYAALNTRESGDKACDRATMTKREFDACRFWTGIGGHNPDADPLGDPRDAAVALNATKVVVQRNYAFSRREIQARRVVTADGTDTAVSRGGASSRSQAAHAGTSSTRGSSNTRGSHESGTVGGSAGVGPFGPYGEAHGSYTTGSYNENTGFGSVTNDSSRSSAASSESFGSSTESRSQHWATALVENTVDHYDYIATFWKKARPDDMILGAFTEPLPRDLWPVIGTRSARVVNAVIGNTPAYYAELWEGDILVAINGDRILGQQGLDESLARHAGQDVTLTIFRDDNFYEVVVLLNNGAPQYANR